MSEENQHPKSLSSDESASAADEESTPSRKKAVVSRFMDFLETRTGFIAAKKWRKPVLQAVPLWIASLLIGFIAVGYAKLFTWIEHWSSGWVEQYPYLIFIVAPIAFLLGWWIVQRWAPFASGSGIPQLMAAIELSTPRRYKEAGRFVSFRVIVVKVLSSICVLLGGGAIGREGPTLQIAGSVFNLVHTYLPKRWPNLSQKLMLITGGAAGLAAAFNTPLGGIVFVVEELTRTHLVHFRTAIFTSVIIAGMVAQWLLGPYLYLGYPKVPIAGFSFVWIVLLASIASGLAGALFGRIAFLISRAKKKLKTKSAQILVVTGCGLAFAGMVYLSNIQSMGSGKEVMTTLLFEGHKEKEWTLPLVRFIGPLLTYASGAAGGIFAPSLSAGATIGYVLSELLGLPPESYNLIILVSMVGFLTGVTRSPFTSAILVLEMTDRHSAIFHLMLAGMVASLVSLLIDKESFYERIKKQYLQSS